MKVLPDQFMASVRSAVGEADADRLFDAIAHEEAVVSVRANPLKGASVPAGVDGVPWEPAGVYLSSRPLFAADPAWHQGRYYVQDASSMVLGAVVRKLVEDHYSESEALTYLDSCAAPGGKSIAALDALPARSFLVANEYDPQRANILAENLAKHGAPNVAVTRGDTRHLGKLGSIFDIAGADVPCSGEGMMRKDDMAVEQWSPQLVEQCAGLQQEILRNVWKAIKPGGFLIYSTCTYNTIENEDNIAMMMAEYGAESIDMGLDRYPGVKPSSREGIYGYRFMPGHVRGEGLFISVLRKPGVPASKEQRKMKPDKENSLVKKFTQIYLRDTESYTFSGTDHIEARPKDHLHLCSALEKHPAPIRIGLPIAELKGKDLAPTHELALSTLLRTGLPAAELPYANALSYLRRETPSLPDGLPRGFVLASYRGYPLGWLKNIGNRANNLFPDYLRLRLDPRHLPSVPPEIPLDLA